MTIEHAQGVKISKKAAWISAIVIILAALFISACNFKLSATLPLIMDYMGIDESAASWLSAIYGVMGLILAIPTAGIVLKLGTKKAALLSLCFAIAGCLMGALVDSYSLLLASRLIEGIGYGTVSTIVPTLIAEIFPAKDRGLPMGIFSCWVAAGMLFIFGTAGLFFDAAQPQTYKNVSWFVLVLMVAALIAVVLVVRIPKDNYISPDASAKKPSLKEGLKSSYSWIAAISFTLYAIGLTAITAFETTYMVQDYGISVASANGLVAFLTIGMIVGGVLMGGLMGKIKTTMPRLLVLLLCSLYLVFGLGFMFSIPQSFIIPFLFVTGFASGALPAVLFTLAAEIAPRPSLVSATMALLSMGMCLGMVLFSAVGGVISNVGWSGSTPYLLAFSSSSFVFMLILYIMMKKRTAAQGV